MLEPQTYRRRPQEVEAVRWDGTQEHAKEIGDWLPTAYAFKWFAGGGDIYGEYTTAEFKTETDGYRSGASVRPISDEYPGDVLVADGETADLLSAREFAALYEPAEPMNMGEPFPPGRPLQGEAFRQGWDALASAALKLLEELRQYLKPEGEGQ
jgi:hypothetical protein